MNFRIFSFFILFSSQQLIAAFPNHEIGVSEFETITSPIKKTKLGQKNDNQIIPILNDSSELIDIRAYGDSGWSWTHESPPIQAEFGQALDDFSPSGEIYRGDLNFINWETTIGYNCEQWHAPYVRGRSYAFLARPENIEQAIERNIENFALSNNHTRDCIYNNETNENGQISSLIYLNQINQDYPNLIYHGVNTENKNIPALIKKSIKGKNIQIAFASYYTGREECPFSVCANDADQLIQNFKKLTADLKIMMIHTMNDQTKLVEVAEKFIREADGDIVFGSGPHRWKPIRYIKKANDRTAIIFDSLGNFLHPSMAEQPRNIIARLLISPENFEIQQIQAISVKNIENKITNSEISPIEIPSELEFKPFEIDSDGKTFKAMYFNLK